MTRPLTREEELQRVRGIPHPGDRPTVVVRAVGPATVLERATAVLEAVLSSEEADPDAAVWTSVLPAWFVARFRPLESPAELALWLEEWRRASPENRRVLEDRRGWALSEWLHWFVGPAPERNWSWCRATVLESDTIKIELLCDDMVPPLAALRFLLESAGATAIEDTFA